MDRWKQLLDDLGEWDRLQRGVPRHEVGALATLAGEALLQLGSTAQAFEAAGDVPAGTTLHKASLRNYLMGLAARCYLAQRLYTYRQTTGMALRDVAQRVDLAHAYLGQIEKCAAGLPSIEKAQLLLELLEIPLWRDELAKDGWLPPTTYEPDSARYRALRVLRRNSQQLPTESLMALAALANSLKAIQPPAAGGSAHHEAERDHPPL